jgi:tetratricopeptide (TPR) repeat protein
MKTFKISLFTTLAAALALGATGASAQGLKAVVHGHVTNPIGQPFANGDVKFTKDLTVPFKEEKFLNVVHIDDKGNYTAADVAAGDYFVYVVQGEKTIWRLDLTVKAGDDKTLDFDMTSDAYVKAMSPEEKKALDEYKKKNAEVVSANKVIESLNATLKTVRADLDAAVTTKADVSKDVDLMKQAVDAKADVALLWLTYGNALLAQGDHLKAQAKKAAAGAATTASSTPKVAEEPAPAPTAQPSNGLTDDVLKNYSDALDAYKKAQTLEAALPKHEPATEGSTFNQIGTVYGHEGKPDDSAAAFESAAKVDPAGAGKYYKNEAVTLFNANRFDDTVVAADKAIAADPKQPLPYYLKGQALVTKSAFDEKTQKLTPPPGCVEAYEMFLQLAPNDPAAGEVKAVLAQMGQKVDTKYKAK